MIALINRLTMPNKVYKTSDKLIHLPWIGLRRETITGYPGSITMKHVINITKMKHLPKTQYNSLRFWSSRLVCISFVIYKLQKRQFYTLMLFFETSYSIQLYIPQLVRLLGRTYWCVFGKTLNLNMFYVRTEKYSYDKNIFIKNVYRRQK